MKRLSTMLIGALLLPAATQAETEGARTGAARSSAGSQQQELYRGSRIIGAAVHDARDRKIGEVKDLLLDSARGEVAYAVLGFGTSRKLYAVPWPALEPSETGRHYILQADREVIAQAPGFDMGDWPDTADQRWSADVDRYWNRMVGRGPFPAQPAAAGNAAGNASSGSGGGKSGSGNAGGGNVPRGERR